MILKRKLNRDFFELLKGSATAFLIKFFGMLVSYIAMIYITNIFGAEKYGTYIFCLIILNILIILPRMGFDNSMVRMLTPLWIKGDLNGVKKTIIKALKIVVFISSLFFFTGILLKDDIKLHITNKGILDNYETLIYAIVPFALLVIVFGSFQSLKRTNLFTLFKFSLVNVFFLVILIINNTFNIKQSLFDVYFLSIIFTTSIGFILLLMNIKKVKVNPTAEVSNGYSYKNMIKLSFPMMLAGSYMFIASWIDIIMIGFYKSDLDVGLYSVAQKIAALSSIFLFAVNAVVAPKFVELYTENDLPGLERVVKNSTKMIFYTTAPILLFFIFFSEFILKINGEEFLAAKIAFVSLCIGQFINSVSGSVGYLMQMTDNQKLFQNVMLGSGVLNFLMNLLLIPKMGINGAAFATTFTMIGTNIYLMFVIKKKLGFWTFYSPLIKAYK